MRVLVHLVDMQVMSRLCHTDSGFEVQVEVDLDEKAGHRRLSEWERGEVAGRIGSAVAFLFWCCAGQRL